VPSAAARRASTNRSTGCGAGSGRILDNRWELDELLVDERFGALHMLAAFPPVLSGRASLAREAGGRGPSWNACNALTFQSGARLITGPGSH